MPSRLQVRRCPIPSSSFPPAWPPTRLPGQAARRHPRRADDRACLAPRAWRPGSARSSSPPTSPAIVEAVETAGGIAVMTRADHPSGSDRIFEAVEALRSRGPARRGRQRAGRPADHRSRARCRPRSCRSPTRRSTSRRSPSRSRGEEERTDPNVVKIIGSPIAPGQMRALYFTRATAPSGEGPLYHHIGLYAYRRAGARPLRRRCRPSPLEKRERLEQLRALEDGMRIDVVARRRRAARRRHAARSRAGPRHPRRAPQRTLKCPHQHTNKVIAYQGEPGANSHIACRDVYPGLGAAALRHLRGRLRRRQGRRRPGSA